jgi:hypothetical protein
MRLRIIFARRPSGRDSERRVQAHCLNPYGTRATVLVNGSHIHRPFSAISKAVRVYRCCYLLNMRPPDLIFNADETCSTLHETLRGAFVEKGTQRVGTKSTAGRSCPLRCSGPSQQPATGPRHRCHHAFGHHPDFLIRCTDKGWTAGRLLSRFINAIWAGNRKKVCFVK